MAQAIEALFYRIGSEIARFIFWIGLYVILVCLQIIPPFLGGIQ